MDSKTFEDIVTAVATLRATALVEADQGVEIDDDIALELVAQELEHIAEELRADD